MTTIINASTSSGLIQTADTSGTLELQSNGTTQLTVSSTGSYGQLKSGTAVTASSTSVDFTSIPSWVKRITVMFNGVSTNGSSPIQIQIGSGSFTTSGYLGSAAAAASFSQRTTGLAVTGAIGAADVMNGACTISCLNAATFVWSSTAMMGQSNAAQIQWGASSVTISGVLDRIRITTVNGTDTFDAGRINILYEG
jgi:hypothetical protein